MDTYQRSWPKAPRARILAIVPGEAVGTWNVFRENFVGTLADCSFEHLPEDAKAWLWRHERDQHQCDHEVNSDCQHYS